MMGNKWYLLFLCFLTFVSVEARERERVIDYPEYESHSGMYLEVYRIRLTKAHAVLEAVVYNKPGYWVMLNSTDVLRGCQTGKTYRLLRMEGFEADTKVAMPDSACRAVKLYFEPIDKQDRAVDWIEASGETLFRAFSLQPPADKEANRVACRIRGKVMGKPTARFLLVESGADIRTKGALSIPVVNRTFDCTLYRDTEIPMRLIPWDEYRDGSWYEVPLFIENGTVDITYFPEGNSVVHSEGTLNREWKQYKQALDTMFKVRWEQLYAKDDQFDRNNTYSEEGKHLLASLDSVHRLLNQRQDKQTEEDLAAKRNALYQRQKELRESGGLYSPAYNAFREQMDALAREQNDSTRQWIACHPSLVGLSLLKEQITKKEQPDTYYQTLITLYETQFEKRWETHPLARSVRNTIDAFSFLRPGGVYPDYTADNLEGKPVHISDLIKGKVALVDLWASWCGPCRTNSKQLIPIYNTYKDKGFTVVGIARERHDTNAMKEAIRKDGYPWMQLVDLNDKNSIWQKHRIENAAGGTYLVDRNGKVLAIDPSPSEVERIVRNVLGGSETK